MIRRSIIILLISLVSCKEDDLLDNTEYFECNKALALTVSSATERIIGKWKWDRQICCGQTTRPTEDKTTYANQIVEFNADGTGVVTKGTNTKPFRWELKINAAATDSFDWVIDSPTGKVVPDGTMYGYIMFCDNSLIFLATPIDGANNFYAKL
jgi:hypothetical protein